MGDPNQNIAVIGVRQKIGYKSWSLISKIKTIILNLFVNQISNLINSSDKVNVKSS